MTNPYALGQLAHALRTAQGSEDASTRARASHRADRWAAVLAGIERGDLTVGSRTPVRGLPAWVTLEVLRGGFATGQPAASGPLTPDEQERVRALGLPATRAAGFASYLTDAGLTELGARLDSGCYRIDLPEEAVLLTVAWLVRVGDRAAALDLLDTVEPFVDRLRFSPRPTARPITDTVARWTAGETRNRLAARRESPRVEAQREALAVWAPLADRFLDLWWATRVDGRVGLTYPDWWAEAAAGLLASFETLAAFHRRTSKHRNPKENLAILIGGTRAAMSGPLDARTRGRVQVAVDGMAAKRGAPGSARLEALRRVQGVVAAAPAHHRLASVAAARLEDLPPDEGLTDPQAYAGPVTPAEADRFAVPEAAGLPPSVQRVLLEARAGTVQELLDDGLVPSGEVLAQLIPPITALTVAQAYPDPALGRLMAAHYRAFRRRRSLLLLNLSRQVSVDELPWVQAVRPYALRGRSDDAGAVGRQVAGLALDHFPGTLLPNLLVRELDQLFGGVPAGVPLVEELAADIFMGAFSPKFTVAAVEAERMVRGTVYARYYDIEADAVGGLEPPGRRPSLPGQLLRLARRRLGVPAGPVRTFADLCEERAFGGPGQKRPLWSVAANGMVIEQGQVLTTHNLAVLVAAGVRPVRPWADLAGAAYARTVALLALATGQRRPLATVKDAAYAWRQALFFLSRAGEAATDPFLAAAEADRARHPEVADQLGLVLGGLRHVASGGRFADDGTCPDGRRLLGWTLGGHWLMAERGGPPLPSSPSGGT